jgi:hypothetical protein
MRVAARRPRWYGHRPGMSELDAQRLQQAAEEAGWLVARGYPAAPTSRFVAEHRALSERDQRLLEGHARMSADVRHHIARELDAEDVERRVVRVDAASVLGTVAAASAGATLLESDAGVIVSPDWNRADWQRQSWPEAAEGALGAIAAVLDRLRPSEVRFVVARDRAGELERLVAGLGKRRWKSRVQPEDDVLVALANAPFVASGDPGVLDACASWVNILALALADSAAPRLRLG